MNGLEYWKIGLTFAGALLGAAIGTPVVEWFKDNLSARRQWATQKAKIVARTRLVMGVLEAFQEMRKEAFGRHPYSPPYSQDAVYRLRKFDFKVLLESIVELSAIHPKTSAQSAIAQRLIQHLIVTMHRFEQLQSLDPIIITDMSDKSRRLDVSDSDKELIEQSDKSYEKLQHFLVGLYALRMGIDPLSLTYDSEIRNFEHAMSQYQLEQAQQEFTLARDAMKAQRAN